MHFFSCKNSKSCQVLSLLNKEKKNPCFFACSGAYLFSVFGVQPLNKIFFSFPTHHCQHVVCFRYYIISSWRTLDSLFCKDQFRRLIKSHQNDLKGEKSNSQEKGSSCFNRMLEPLTFSSVILSPHSDSHWVSKVPRFETGHFFSW